MYQVVKRDGSIAEFRMERIRDAIQKAFVACNKHDHPSVTDFLALKTVSHFEPKIKNELISVEDIQDSVEEVLIQAGYADVAKAYILYRKQHEKMRDIKGTFLDYKELVNSYVNVTDWRVKENSTVTYSVGGLILSNSGAITANYWLSEVYDDEIANAHRNADIHLHDLSMLTGYCAGWSLKQLIQEGLGGIPGKITSAPASHLSTLCNQIVNFLGIMQNEWAGAQAFSSFDTYLAPFVKVDNLSYKEVKQCIQSFIYGVNTPSRWGTQAPFSNITLDWTVPADLAELNCIVGGKEVDFKYKDCKAEMDMINKAFIEIMIEGDANGRGFQYPIPTYSITKDFDWSETENNKLLFEMTSKYGTPYFSNYVNSDMEPSDVRSMAILGTQNVIYQDKYGRVSKNEIRHLVNNWVDKGVRGYKMLMNGKFIDVIDMFRVPYEKYSKIVALQTELGTTQRFSYDHKCPIIRNGQYLEVLSQDVCAGDKLLLAKHPYSESNVGSYEAGKILGYYIAEGWHAHTDEIMFAVNERRNDIMSEIREFFSAYGCQINVEAPLNHACKVHVYGKAATGFVDMYVKGDKALNKRLLVGIYNTSSDFRTGLYDGYYTTDGCPKAHSFAHTTNKSLCFDFIDAFSTIGKYFRYSENHNNTRYFKPDKSDKEAFTSYKLQVAKLEEYNEDYFLCEVQNVALEDASRINSVYNFTVSTKEHLYQLPNGIITHQCCRLRLDLRELRKKSGGFFGSGESTGSVGVVTINLPRIAYLAKDEKDFYDRLDKMLDIAARSLKVKRTTISKLLDEGLYPYTKRYLGTFENHFSTIGIIGMNEAGLNAKWLRADLTDPKTQIFAKDVLNHIRTRLSDYQEMYGDLYNLEATPAESTSYRLAKHDVKRYPDIITASKETPYYTNSTHLPVGYTEDMFTALDIQDELQTLYNSGTVFHAFLGEKLPDWKASMKLVRTISENYKLPYYTISPVYSVCKNHGYITGEVYKCPECGEKTEVYSRITGYYRPVQNWNDGKAQEFKDRKMYVPKSVSNSKEGSCAECKVAENIMTDNNNTEIVLPVGNYLFKTETCPNCKIAESKLDKASIPYVKMVANENVDLVKSLGIKQAPTLVVVREATVDKFVGTSQIIQFIADNK